MNTSSAADSAPDPDHVDEQRAHRQAELARATKAVSLGAILGLALAWAARRRPARSRRDRS